MNIACSFLYSSASFLSSFSKIREKWILNPALIVSFSIFLSFLLAFTNIIYIQVPIILFSFILAYKIKATKYVLTVFLFTSLFVIASSIPYIALLIIGKGNLKVLSPFLNLYLRSISSSLSMTLGMEYLGWYGLTKGLNRLRIPKHVTYLFILFILVIPELLRYLAKLLLSREARIISYDKRLLLVFLSISVLDLLLYSSKKIWWLERAVKARTFIS